MISEMKFHFWQKLQAAACKFTKNKPLYKYAEQKLEVISLYIFKTYEQLFQGTPLSGCFY